MLTKFSLLFRHSLMIYLTLRGPPVLAFCFLLHGTLFEWDVWVCVVSRKSWMFEKWIVNSSVCFLGFKHMAFFIQSDVIYHDKNTHVTELVYLVTLMVF